MEEQGESEVRLDEVHLSLLDLVHFEDVVDADGQKINMSATVPWDGMEHKVDGPMGPAMVAVKIINDRTHNVTAKVNGKVVAAGRAVVSKDGKTMTSSFKGEDPKGRKFDNVEVYDKQ